MDSDKFNKLLNQKKYNYSQVLGGHTEYCIESIEKVYKEVLANPLENTITIDVTKKQGFMGLYNYTNIEIVDGNKQCVNFDKKRFSYPGRYTIFNFSYKNYFKTVIDDTLKLIRNDNRFCKESYIERPTNYHTMFKIVIKHYKNDLFIN